MSGIHAILSEKNPKNRWLLTQIDNSIKHLIDKKIEIKLMWVPSHIGITGNEEADRLAGLPNIMEDLPSDINKIVIEVPVRINTFKNVINKSITQTWKNNIPWRVKEMDYVTYNTDLKPPNIKSLPRSAQCEIHRLRCGSYEKCVKGCQTICVECRKPFNLVHFLLKCDKSLVYYNQLAQYIDPNNINLSDRDLVSLFMSREDQAGFPIIKEMVQKYPPEVRCTQEKHKIFHYKTPWSY